MKPLIWQTDFQGLICDSPICGRTQIDENVCIFCLNAKKTKGKLDTLR